MSNQKDNKEYREIAFDIMKEGSCFTIENQDGLLENVTKNDILQFIQYIMEDDQQFATLTAPKAIKSIRFVQAAVNNGEIEVEIGVEKEKCHLYYKMCTREECEKIFLDFFHGKFVVNMVEYKPVLFMYKRYSFHDGDIDSIISCHYLTIEKSICNK